MTAAERRHMSRIKECRCVFCVYIGLPAEPGCDVHHPREGQGMGQRAGHFLGIALCKEHHQGGTGIHGLGTRAFEVRYKITELDLVDMTLQQIYGGA